MSVTIRPETTADLDAIRHVNYLAFGQDDEARLVDALREGGFVRASLCPSTPWRRWSRRTVSANRPRP